jgi:hypothetical protein
VDLEALRLAIGAAGRMGSLVGLTEKQAQAYLAALERAERVEKAARAMQRWQGEMWRMGVLAQQDIDALIAALAAAPAEEGSGV